MHVRSQRTRTPPLGAAVMRELVCGYGDVGRVCATRSSTASCAQLLRWWDARVWLRRCGRGLRLLFVVCARCSLPSMTPPVWAARVGVQIRRCGQGCAFALRGVVLVFIAEHVSISAFLVAGCARWCADTAMWARFPLRSTWYGARVFTAVRRSRWCADTATRARILLSLYVVCCSCVHCRVGVQIRRCGHGFCLRSPWVGARVFIAVLEVRVGGQIRRCGHGLRSEGLKLVFFSTSFYGICRTPSIRTSSPREEPLTANSCWLSRARGGGDAGSLTPRCSAT